MKTIEEIVKDFLQEKLKIPVLFEVPARTIPEKFIVLERVGLGERDHVKTLSLAVQSISTRSRYDADILDHITRDVIHDIVFLPEISGIYLSASYDHTDTSTGRYRYQSVYDISYV